MKKRILFVVSNLKVGGGAENYIATLTNSIYTSAKYDVEMVTFYDFSKEYSYSCKRESFKYLYSNNIIVKLTRLLIIFPYLLNKFLKQKYQKNIVYDIIISNAEDANIVSLIVSKIFNSKLKIVPIIHSDLFASSYKLSSFLYTKCSSIIVVSKSLQESYSQVFLNSKLFVVYNPFDMKLIETYKSKSLSLKDRAIFEGDDKIIISVGRLTSVKNYPLLFRVFQRVQKKHSNVKLVVLGDGSLQSELQELIYSLNLEDKIYLLGVKENIYPYLLRSDLFVLTSSSEGFGRVILEALSVGLPVVSNHCLAGPSEILDLKTFNELHISRYKKAKFGYLVPYNNEMEFVKAIEDALLHPNYYATSSISRARDFSVKNVSQDFISVLEQINN